MVEQYAAQQLEILTEDTDWERWGNALKAVDVFANEAIPETDDFDDWFNWAAALLAAVNPRTA